MNQTITRAKYLSFFWTVYFASYGLLASVCTKIYGEGWTQLYLGFYAFTSFWCSILMFMITIKFNQIPSADKSGVNIKCYRSTRTLFQSILYHDEFLIQRRLALYFILILFFHSSWHILKYLFLKIDIPFAFVLPSFISGLVTLFYSYCYFFYMLLNYPEYSIDFVYQLHVVNSISKETEYRRKVILKSILFCVIAVIYYIVKAIIYLICGIVKYQLISENILPYSIIVIIQSLLCGVLFGWICFSLINILQRVAQNQMELVKNNQTSFTCWFTLVLSLLFSSRHRNLTVFIIFLQIVQAGYGLKVVLFSPFKNSNKYIFGKQFIFWDNLILTLQIIFFIIKLSLRLKYGEQLVQRGFSFTLKNFLIPPQGKNQAHGQNILQVEEQIQVNEKFPITPQKKELCTLCNQSILENELIEISSCSSSHSFHQFCLTPEIINQQTCPGCGKEQKK